MSKYIKILEIVLIIIIIIAVKGLSIYYVAQDGGL